MSEETGIQKISEQAKRAAEEIRSVSIADRPYALTVSSIVGEIQSAITAATADLERQLEEERGENEHLIKDLERMACGDLVKAEVSEGRFDATIKHPFAIAILARSFASTLRELNAENYVEMSFRAEGFGIDEQVVVIVKREGKKSPHALRAEAEAERDQLRAANEELAREVERLRTALQEAGDIKRKLLSLARAIDSLGFVVYNHRGTEIAAEVLAALAKGGVA